MRWRLFAAATALLLAACGGGDLTPEQQARLDAGNQERMQERRQHWVDTVETSIYVFSPTDGVECVTIAWEDVIDCHWTEEGL